MKVSILFLVSIFLIVVTLPTVLGIPSESRLLFDRIFKPPVEIRDSTLETCTIQGGCVSKGAACAGSLGSSTCDLHDNNCCAAGLLCYMGSCVDTTLGLQCNVSSDCAPGYQACQDGMCQDMAGVGDSCVSDDLCISGMCQNSVCVGLPLGSACSYRMFYDCEFGLMCTQAGFTCVNSIPMGSPCNYSGQC